jgi:hypothetical protein
MQALVASCAEMDADDLRWDQENVGLTGLEPQFDDPGSEGEKVEPVDQTPPPPS